MRYRELGRSGLRVSVVGLGCNNFGTERGGGIDADQTRTVVDAAIENGITLFDTADVYGGQGKSETWLGEALKGRRETVVLATKFGAQMGGEPDYARASRRYIKKAVEDSLRRLQTDYIDLYQLHRPDGITPIEETLEALDDLVHQGKVLYVGSSNFDGWQVVDADWVARTTGVTRFVSAQNRYNLLERHAEAELLPACERAGVGLLPFYPLASGLLTGKYRKGKERPIGTRLDRTQISEAEFDRIERLAAFAEERGHTLLEVAFAGLLAQPAVSSVIAGATSPEQIKGNLAAADWELTAEDKAALAEL